MKKTKKAAINFMKLNANEMGKVKGGQWIEITDKNGNKSLIWI